MTFDRVSDLFARKGEAAPSPFRSGDLDDRYLRPRRIIGMQTPVARPVAAPVRHFSLRLDTVRRERLRRLAETAGTSCQKMLMRLILRSTAWSMPAAAPETLPWRHKFTLRLDPVDHCRLRALAAHHGLSAQQTLVRLIDTAADRPAPRAADAA